MSRLIRIHLARVLAVVMIVTSTLNAVVVECRASDHHAIELIGHQVEAASCAASACRHDDHHDDDCDDRSLIDEMAPQRADQDQELGAADQAWATAPATPDWWNQGRLDGRDAPRVRPRRPPRSASAIDAFVTLRLLI